MYRDITVSEGLMAFDLMICNLQHAFTIIGLITGNGPALNGRRHRKRLRRGARFVGIHDAVIFPQAVELSVHLRIVQTV